jgi:hypothetical protein
LQFPDGFDGLIDELIKRGKRIFLDANMFDIGETVRQGVARMTERAAARHVSRWTPARRHNKSRGRVRVQGDPIQAHREAADRARRSLSGLPAADRRSVRH